MTTLILLTFGNGNVVRCNDIHDAKSKAIASAEGRILVEMTPEGLGGPITTLEFDRDTQDWTPI